MVNRGEKLARDRVGLLRFEFHESLLPFVELAAPEPAPSVFEQCVSHAHGTFTRVEKKHENLLLRVSV